MKFLKRFTYCILLLIFTLQIECLSFAASDEINTYSPACILMESKTGKVIYEKNMDELMYPASTTKVMTAILTLENCKLTDIATASYNAVHSVPYSYTHANIQVGEELTINQLLHALLIPSANDAATVLAEHIAGSVESFSSMMNAKAVELGCKNTNFVNPNGVHDDNHFSTAYDLALIGRYAMQNETFRKIVSETVYTLPATNKYSTNDRVFWNTNQLIQFDDSDSVDNYYYPYATGVKTGYTDPAQQCIIASSKKDDIEYIVVILGASTTSNGLSERYLDCKALFNYAFENYSLKTLYEKNSILKNINVPGGSFSTRSLPIAFQDEICVVYKNGTNPSQAIPTVSINSDLKAPITKDSIVGKITYTIDGREYYSNLIATQNVEDGTLETTILTIISILVVLYLLYRLFVLGKKKKKKRNSKKYLYW